MHDNGIVHGNITSRNVFVSKGLKLLPISTPKLEFAEMSNYSAPEMVTNKADANHKVDIWAAGCIFYEMMMGKPLLEDKLTFDKLDEVEKMLEVPFKHNSLVKDEEIKTDSDSLFGKL